MIGLTSLCDLKYIVLELGQELCVKRCALKRLNS